MDIGSIRTGECGPYCTHPDQQLQQHKCRYCKKFIHLLCCYDAGIPFEEFSTDGDICVDCWNKKPNASEGSTYQESNQKDEGSPSQGSAQKKSRSLTAKSTAASSKKSKDSMKKKKNRFTKMELKKRKKFQAEIIQTPMVRFYKDSEKDIILTTEELQKNHPNAKVWRYFRRYKNSSLSTMVACVACKDIAEKQPEGSPKVNFSVTVGSKSNTSHLVSHLQTYHKNLHDQYLACNMKANAAAGAIERFCVSNSHEAYKKT